MDTYFIIFKFLEAWSIKMEKLTISNENGIKLIIAKKENGDYSLKFYDTERGGNTGEQIIPKHYELKDILASLENSIPFALKALGIVKKD